jgi:hypothetical protein
MAIFIHKPTVRCHCLNTVSESGSEESEKNEGTHCDFLFVPFGFIMVSIFIKLKSKLMRMFIISK